MLITRDGYPEPSDLVMCTVTNIQHNSIFVNIHEYNKQGMITISEIAPGRIRNIRDYVVEGKVIICKVLNVNKERGYIDLSLRRVTEGQRRQKSDEVKQETRAEKIIELTAHELKIPVEQLYHDVADKLLTQYFYLYQAFDDVINGNLELKSVIDEKIASVLEKNIREKIKPKQIVVAGDVLISVWDENGIELIKNTLINSISGSDTKIIYLGGGKYRILVKGTDYKVVEKNLKDTSDKILASIKKVKGKAEYARVKNISLESEQ
ncbi:MAG: translation initiation factor IF-2 subunit alpha [Candidatus Woesearchaeota archaeon]|nr:MAG: translation initiation factor IF-2 subunit alpha [Candidatus Woesearchaeota archaeon]